MTMTRHLSRPLLALRWVVFALLLSDSGTALSYDDPRPINQSAINTRNVLLSRDFERLERTAAQLKQSPRLLSDGQPELAGFYAGVSMCVQLRCGDQNLPPQIWADHAAVLDEWIAAYPKSVTARVAKANFIKESAWYARGTGFADSVTPAQWKEFEVRVSKARSMFEEIAPEGKSDPAWFSGMLSVALMQTARV